MAVQGTLGGHVPTSQPRSLQAETSICSFEHELECASTLDADKVFLSIHVCPSVHRMQRFGGVEASKIAVQAGSSAHSDARCMVHTNISYCNVKKHIPPSAHVTVEISLQDHDVMEPPS